MSKLPAINAALGATVLWISFTGAFAAEATVLSGSKDRSYPFLSLFRDHVASAKVHDPQFRFSLESVESQTSALLYAESLLKPKVSLSANSFQTERTELSTNFLGARNEQQNRLNSSIVTIQARQTLYKPRDVFGVRQSESQKQLAAVNLKAAQQDLLQRLLSGWFDIFYTQDLKKLAVELLEASQVVNSEAQKRFNAGDIALQEAELAKSRVATAEALVYEAELQRQIAQESLWKIIGRDGRLPDAGSVHRVLKIDYSGASLSEFRQRVLSRNYDIISAKEKVEVRRFEREKVSAEYKPVIEAFASTSRGQNDSVSFIKDEKRIGVQLNVPIYTFGTIASAVAQADALYRAELSRLRDIEIQSNFVAVKINNDLASLKRKVEAFDSEQEALTINLTAQLKGLKAGVNTRAEISRTVQDRSNIGRQALVTRKQFFTSLLDFFALSTDLDEIKAESIIQYFSR